MAARYIWDWERNVKGRRFICHFHLCSRACYQYAGHGIHSKEMQVIKKGIALIYHLDRSLFAKCINVNGAKQSVGVYPKISYLKTCANLCFCGYKTIPELAVPFACSHKCNFSELTMKTAAGSIYKTTG